jgi:hypothetical protein
MKGAFMRSAVVAVILTLVFAVLACPVWAGEKEELGFQKQLIETQFQVLQLQIDKQFGEQSRKLQGDYKVVIDKLAAMEPQKPKPMTEKQEKKVK